MACFLAPMSLAIVTTIFRNKVPENLKINLLNIMLWGGVLALAVEHIAHGEVVLFPPFLTAMNNPEDIPVMLHEIATIGVAMTLAIIFVWLILVLVTQTKTEKLKKPSKT